MVHVKTGNVPADLKMKFNYNRIYFRGDSKSKTCKAAAQGKEHDGERGSIKGHDCHCQRGSKESCQGGYQGDEEEEENKVGVKNASENVLFRNPLKNNKLV